MEHFELGGLNHHLIPRPTKLATTGVAIELAVAPIAEPATAAPGLPKQRTKNRLVAHPASQQPMAVQQHAQVATLASLEAAVQGINSLSKAAVVELKSFAAPPHAVKLVMEAVCILLGCTPSWAESKKLLGDTSFLGKLASFDRDGVPAARLRKLRKYVRLPELHLDAVKKVSAAAEGLMKWVLAVAAWASIRTGVAIELAVAPIAEPATAAPGLPKQRTKNRPVAHPASQQPMAVQQHAQVATLASLEAAVQGINSLSKAAVVELKSFAAPPHAVKLVMEAVCILLGCTPSWAESKKLLGDTSFLGKLASFDRDGVPAARLRKLRKYVRLPELHLDAVKKVSAAAEGLMKWVLAVAAWASIRTGVAIELAVAPIAEPATAAPGLPKQRTKNR
eukprot:COSAG02_NODE_10768_length_1861_cov_20.941544_2_plen_392_part_01